MNDVSDEIASYLRQAGFYECSRVADIPPDAQQLSALVERWRRETHTFHFRVGECTITLQDVAVQLGLRINGAAVKGCVCSDWKPEILRLLGRPVTDNDLNGNKLKMTWINANFHNYEEHRHDAVSRIQYTRAYILRLMGGVLFPDSSGCEVPLRYLPYLEDFNVCASYSWGSAVLAYLYHALCQATSSGRVELNGCALLLQLWAWHRIPGTGPNALNMVPGIPFGARWEPRAKGLKYPINWYRTKLDTMTQNDFVWTPYADYFRYLPQQCVVDNEMWLAVTPMICYHMVEWHQPDRVLMQFGLSQPIPDASAQDDEMHYCSLRGKTHVNWRNELRGYIEMWDARVENIFPPTPPSTCSYHMRTWILVSLKASTLAKSVSKVYSPLHATTLSDRVYWFLDFKF